MGTGIGLVASSIAGINVKFIEVNEKGQANSRKFVEGWAKKEVEKKKLTED
jgi:3-hydroxyacyl-CoA dehydrogenase